MAYQKAEYYFIDLPQETLYRFAEIEITGAHTALHVLFKNSRFASDRAVSTILDILFPDSSYQDKSDEFERVMGSSAYFRRPQKHELIHYCLWHHQSYQKVQRLVRVSPNTIQKESMRSAPIHYPIYKEWTPEMLKRWNNVKNALNIWNETLVHSPENEKDPERYEE